MCKGRANTVNLTGGRDCRSHQRAFSLLEVLTALVILAFTSSSVLYVINRCMASTANSALQMEAFQVARENLEQVLVSESLTENVEFGTSELYPSISWRTAVEAFSEPVSGEMWTRAVCSADYLDALGETQTIELVHWIGPLTDQQANQLLQEEDLEALAADQLVGTIEEAAEHAGVDVETIEEWLQNGLLTTGDGEFIRYNLDIYVSSGGAPSEEDRARQVESIEDLAMRLQAEREDGTDGPNGSEGTGGIDPTTGLPYEELEQMGVGEVMDRLKDRQDRSR